MHPGMKGPDALSNQAADKLMATIGNWADVGRPGEALPFVPKEVQLDRIGVTGGTVILTRAGRPVATLKNVAGDASAASLRGPYKVSTTYTFEDRKQELKFSTSAANTNGKFYLKSALRDPDVIRRLVPTLIDAIGMRAHGPLHLERFGDADLEGWSAMQFIETSSITLHADEVYGRCFIDVFSCKPFDAHDAVAIARAAFGGSARVRVLSR